MVDKDKKEIIRIKQRITKFAKMGEYGFREYTDYVDTLIKTGKVDYFNFLLETSYSIDYTKFRNIIRLRDYAWSEILIKTNSSILESVQSLMERNNVYQLGNEIRKYNNDAIKYELSETLDTNRQILATSSKIGFTYSNDKLLLNILDNHVNKVKISSVDWATYSITPKNTYEIQTIESQKYYETVTYTASVTSGIINNLNTYTNSLNISEISSDDIYKIDLNINVEYTTIGDLNINLKSPNGRIINVKKYDLDLESGTRYDKVTFTTENKHNNLYNTNEDIEGGTYSMDKILNIGPEFHVSNTSKISDLLVNNKNISGEWVLSIKDYREQGFGRILGWSLSLGKLIKGTYLTQSQCETDINTQLKSTYLVEVDKRNPYGKFLYMLNVDNNNLLGTINEINFSNLIDSKYHMRSRRVMEVLGIEKTFLEATRYDNGETLSILSDDPKFSEERNLYQRYVMALNFLLE